MPGFDSSGNYTRWYNWQTDATNGVKILADRHDREDDEFANALSSCITKDGRTQPTADIPMNGKKLTNLAAPISPTDAVTKAYVDAIKTFSTGLIVSGADANGLVSFTSATGFTGLSFTNADCAWIARKAETPANYPNRLALNSKPDGSGLDVFWINAENGGMPTTMGGGFGNNIYVHSGGWRVQEAGWGNLLSLDKASGHATLYTTGTTSSAAGAIVTLSKLWSVQPDGDFSAKGSVQAENGNFIGNVGGGVVLAPAASGTVYLRPRSWADATCQWTLDNAGNVSQPNGQYSMAGPFITQSNVTCNAVGANSWYYKGDGTFTVGVSGALRLFQWGANLYLSYNTSDGTITCVKNSTSWSIDGANNFSVYAGAFKPGGGSWAASSDARIKTVLGDYDSGLDAVKGLRPVLYTYRGNDTGAPPSNYRMGEMPEEGVQEDKSAPSVPYKNSIHYPQAESGQQFVGLIAQEVEAVMPGMVSRTSAYIDGEPVDDLRQLDTTSLIFALVNAVKQLAAKVEALEAREP